MKGNLLLLSQLLFLSFLVVSEALILPNLLPKQLQDILPLSVSDSAAAALLRTFPNPFVAATNVSPQQLQVEQDLIQAIESLDGRLTNSDTIDQLVQKLESIPSIPRPAVSSQIYGRWRLLHTTNADTASPIQRKAVSSKQFPIYQDILVVEKPNQQPQQQSLLTPQLIVRQVVN
jgi:PAP_fibrillin